MNFLALVEGNFFSGLELKLKCLVLVEGNFFSGLELNLKFLALVEGNFFFWFGVEFEISGSCGR